jgi:hypothetical protein
MTDLPLDLQRVIYGYKYRMESEDNEYFGWLGSLDPDVGEELDMSIWDLEKWKSSIEIYNSTAEGHYIEIIDTFDGVRVCCRYA